MEQEEKKGILCKCPKCGYEWTYSGSSKWYISCPRCRHAMRSPLYAKSQ